MALHLDLYDPKKLAPSVTNRMVIIYLVQTPMCHKSYNNLRMYKSWLRMFWNFGLCFNCRYIICYLVP